MRFDEMELQSVPLPDAFELPKAAPSSPRPVTAQPSHAPRFRRLLTLLTDLSLFAALSLALSPLLPARPDWTTMGALAGFVVLTSYHYFVGAWLIWGKTIGGAIFDVRVTSADDEAMSLVAASKRWAGIFASLLSGGLGFLIAALPGRLSLPDRVSGTRCITS